MPHLPADTYQAILEALSRIRNARAAAREVGIDPATAWCIAKREGIELISQAEHQRKRMADPAYRAKQAPAARAGASRWLKKKHKEPAFHAKTVRAARRNLKRLNSDPAFREASSLRLKERYDEPEFRIKQAAAASKAASLRHSLRKKKSSKKRKGAK